MSQKHQITRNLIEHLPPVRGSYKELADLSRHTRFHVGGPAEVLFKPADQNDLQAFMLNTPKEIPITVIGVGSNILVRDGGIAGVVVRLGKGFSHTAAEGGKIETGAGALNLNVARFAQQNCLSGLEFLSGIPGTIGGTLKMNGGAYGREIADVTLKTTVLDRKGQISILDRTNLDFTYRKCGVPDDYIFISAELAGSFDTKQQIATQMNIISENRNSSQPTSGATGGSTFKNPPGKKAWKMIEKAGCRGLRIGGAMVSEKHCNFLVNINKASAADLEMLAEEVRQRVIRICGVNLEWEICRIGNTEAIL